jgi:hypothetical protein
MKKKPLKPLLFSTRTWSKFETSNPDRLVGPLKFDKLFFCSESESIVLCVNFKSQNLWLQTPLVWVGPWNNGKFELKIAVQHETRAGTNYELVESS